MPTKKLTALSIPTLAPGEWYDAVLPGLILRVGVKRRTWQFRYHAGGSYHRKPLGHFPAMELAEAREAARKLIDRADKGVPIEVSAPHPRCVACAHLGALFDRYEALRTGKASGSRRWPRRCGCCGEISNPICRCPPTSSARPICAAARDAMVEAEHVIAAQPHAAAARAGDEMGGAGGFDPDQFRSGHPPGAGERSAAAC